ncbi:hypothetical protein KYB31_05765 [Clostridium felsineum]|uniref:hypothetical protein n=1 Tax=Clostridium felsineum TaxID=36839 RepID=UPI00214DE50D|nr:hypothetical protein [Clostridium felsineum]MCR3758502.1 hypothetical protein [Clostridium felsineum]
MVKVIFDCKRVQPNNLEKKKILKAIDICGYGILSQDEKEVFWYMYKDLLLVVKTMDEEETIVIKDFIFNITKTIDIKEEKREKSVLELYREKKRK